MNQLVGVALALWALCLGSCASGPVPVSGGGPVDTMTHLIVLQSGGSVEWGFDDGGAWSLSMDGQDGLLKVDGATVHLMGIAPGETLEFRHNSGPEDWRLEMWGGGWVCERDRIRTPKGEYSLGSGTEITLDVMGNPIEDSNR